MPAFCIFCGLCILTLFSLLTVNMRGVSNKHCLLHFFIVPANFANVIMLRHHTQNGVTDDLHSTAVYFRVFTNFSIKW